MQEHIIPYFSRFSGRVATLSNYVVGQVVGCNALQCVEAGWIDRLAGWLLVLISACGCSSYLTAAYLTGSRLAGYGLEPLLYASTCLVVSRSVGASGQPDQH